MINAVEKTQITRDIVVQEIPEQPVSGQNRESCMNTQKP